MKLRSLVYFLLFIHLALIVWVSYELPIGPYEAKIYFLDQNIVSLLMHLGKSIFPNLDFLNIRLPFLIIHLINLILFFYLSKLFLKDEVALFVSFMIFFLLPGIVSSAVLATSTGITMAIYQGFLILFLTKRRVLAYILVSLLIFVDRSSVVLYFALLTYALWRREVFDIAFIVVILGASVSIYGTNIHGKPLNHFVDTVGLYAAIFSPLVFLYFFYSIYRILLKGDKNIIWHISFTVLILSLILSLRQRVSIQDFAPFVVVAIPLMVRLFFNSYKVRLPQFRKKYFIASIFVCFALLLNTLVLLFHKPLFMILPNPQKHFASPFYYPFWCANALKKIGINSIKVDKKKMQLQLKYYDIKKSDKIRLHSLVCKNCKKVSIRYKDRELKSCYVSKINN